MTETLHEAGGYRQGTRAVVPQSKGQRIEVRLMGWEPGSKVVEGSSADYPIERIVRDFPESFPIGTRMRANHDGFCEAGGDIRRIMAKTVTVPEVREDGMYAWAVMKEGEPSDFIRQFADAIGTSISVAAEIEKVAATDEDGQPILDAEGNVVLVPKLSERGAHIVERFLTMMESPYNAVDFVEAPGADGAIVALATESAKQIFEHSLLKEDAKFAIGLAGDAREKTSEAIPPRITKKENSMLDTETQALVEAAATRAVEAFAESTRPSTPASDQPTFGQMAESIIAAGLSESGRQAVYERTSRGEGLNEAIAAEAKREADIEAEVERRVNEREAAKQESSAFGFGYTSDDQTGKSLATEGTDITSREGVNAAFDAAFAEEN